MRRRLLFAFILALSLPVLASSLPSHPSIGRDVFNEIGDETSQCSNESHDASNVPATVSSILAGGNHEHQNNSIIKIKVK